MSNKIHMIHILRHVNPVLYFLRGKTTFFLKKTSFSSSNVSNRFPLSLKNNFLKHIVLHIFKKIALQVFLLSEMACFAHNSFFILTIGYKFYFLIKTKKKFILTQFEFFC